MDKGAGVTYLRPNEFGQSAYELGCSVVVLGHCFVVDNLADCVPESGFEALYQISMLALMFPRRTGGYTSSFSGSMSAIFHIC